MKKQLNTLTSIFLLSVLFSNAFADIITEPIHTFIDKPKSAVIIATNSTQPDNTILIIEVGQSITLSVSGTSGEIIWTPLKGQIQGTGNQVTYIAPTEIGVDVVTVLDEIGNVGIARITMVSTVATGLDFSVENTDWKVFKSRKEIGAITLSKDGKTLWVGTAGGLEQREASSGRLIKVFTNIDGLLGMITSIYAEENGDIWVGAIGAGLAHRSSADGTWKFFNFETADLPSYIVSAIQADGEGGLWIAMIGFPNEGGIAHLTANRQWEIFTTQNSDLPWGDIQLFKVANNSEFWAAPYNGDIEILRFDEQDNLVMVPHPGPGLLHRTTSGVWEVFSSDNSQLPSHYIQDLSPDDKGGIWISTGDKGLAYRDSNGNWEILTAENSGLPSSQIHDLLPDGNGGLWIGLADGRLVHRTPNGDWETFSDPQNPNLTVDTANMRGFLMDEQQRLWFGNVDGLANRTKEGQWQHLDSSALSSNFVRTVSVEKNEVWVGTKEKGVSHRTANGDWEIFNQSNSDLPSDNIKALLSDEQGGVWIATAGGLAHRSQLGHWEIFTSENTGFPSNTINALSSDGQGGIWIGMGTTTESSGEKTLQPGGLGHLTNTGHWQFFTADNSGLPSNNVTALQTDAQGGLWLGTATVYRQTGSSFESLQPGAGLAHLTAEGNWEIFNKDNSELPSNDINAIYLDSNNELWVGTGILNHTPKSSGLAHRLADGHWEFFNTDNAPLQNSVQAIQADGIGGLWVGSYRGGVAHRQADGHWEWFSTHNSGLPGNEIYALYSDEYQNLWIGSDHGLAHLTFGQKLTGDLSGHRAAILIYPESRGGERKHISNDNIVGYAYQALSERYYRNEEIYFLAYKPEIDVNGDYYPDTTAVDAPVTFFAKADGTTIRSLTVDDIRQAFEWAKEKGALNQPLMLIIIADGLSEGKLLLDPATNEFITGTQLATLLDDYQQSTQNEVIVIVEASHAGALMPALAPLNRSINRIVMTSTSAEQPTQQTDVLGRDAFSWRYFHELRRGTNIWDSFHLVSRDLPQRPQIDDDHRAGRFAKRMCLNGCFTLHADKTVYQDGDMLRLSLPNGLPRDKRSYIGIAFPDGTLFTFNELNALKPFDGTILPPWQGENVVMELPITADWQRGEYPLYLLRVKEGVDPLAHPEFWELNIGAITIE